MKCLLSAALTLVFKRCTNINALICDKRSRNRRFIVYRSMNMIKIRVDCDITLCWSFFSSSRQCMQQLYFPPFMNPFVGVAQSSAQVKPLMEIPTRNQCRLNDHETAALMALFTLTAWDVDGILAHFKSHVTPVTWPFIMFPSQEKLMFANQLAKLDVCRELCPSSPIRSPSQ